MTGSPTLAVEQAGLGNARLLQVGERTRDVAVLAGLMILAAVLRFLELPTRGPWDADQGHDLLVLHALVHDGAIPLLGPPTSIGDFHHGAWYYYLLAPAAFLSGSSPEGIAAAIALGGVVAVAVTWWIARLVGGSIAALVAGLVMAVSASAIEESTFIWNPNLIALSSALAVAGAWRAWTTGRTAWWLLAFGGTVATMQLHVLGVVFMPPIAGLFAADAWRRRGSREARAGHAAAALGGLVILAVGYLPLVVHEATHDFAETRAALAYVSSGGESSPLHPAARVLFVGLRSVAWPLTGLVTNALPAAVAAAAAIAAILAWRGRAGRETERAFVRWAAVTLAWAAIALATVAGGLSTVVPGLPNDHYHAFLDPIVFVVIGLGAAALWRQSAGGRAGRRLGRAAAVGGVGVLVVFNMTIWPPAVAPDGGWPAARAAAERVSHTVGDREVALHGLPAFKSPDAIGYPLVDRGIRIVPVERAGALVIACDALFERAIGAACGGPAEDRALGARDRFVTLADRFPASPRTTISVYLAAGGSR